MIDYVMFQDLLMCLPATGFLGHLAPAQHIATPELLCSKSAETRKHQVPSWARQLAQSFASRSRHLARVAAGKPPSLHVCSFYK